MGPHVCPWWFGYFMLGPIRRLAHDPRTLLQPYVKESMTVLEPGPGMGYFTLELARLVGSTGRVIAVDIQQKMLDGLRRRAEKAGVAGRIKTRLAPSESMALEDLAGRIDFALGFWTVHEFPDIPRFFAETAAALKTGGRLLVVEPRLHVPAADFAELLKMAATAGFRVDVCPAIWGSYAALLVK
jgi:ubiquinone/menaquinone biosynthesis C-methylase UbiE